MPSLGLNTLQTSLEMSSLEDSQKQSMTFAFAGFWILPAVLGALSPVRYHRYRLVSDSFNRTDTAPLRASVLLKYGNWLTEPEQNNGTWAADVLWPAINLDLQWISVHWNESTYVDQLLVCISS